MSRYQFPLARTWRWLALTSVLGIFFAVLFSFATPLQYSSSVRVLITQPNVTGLDPYTALKSTERIAGSLSELVYSTTFYNNVVSQAQGLDATYFPTDEYAQRQAWRKTVATTITPGTGIMNVTAYHPNRQQARILVAAVARELAVEAPNFFGYSVRVQVIDSPLDSRWFARPDFVVNGFFGLFIGLLLGIAWILVRGRSAFVAL
jgi:uncharacterized protein involved in exopolysaccharide biosynthesis